MKLYYAPGSCSLSPHIALREAGAKFDLVPVDLREKKLKDSGDDYWAVNAKGQVPVLELDSGERISENPVIVQYIADKHPAAGIAPPPGTADRYRMMEWLSHVGSELHKTYGPMFRPTTPEEYKKLSRDVLTNRLKNIDKHLASREYLMGERFTVADAYMFAVLRWSPRIELDLTQFSNVAAYMDRMRARPAVAEAMKVEGLTQ